jgi:putative flippase GtrA
MFKITEGVSTNKQKRGFEKLKPLGLIMGKYGITSVIVTSIDFTISYILYRLGVSSLMSTITGRSIGAVLAFTLHRAWVFKDIAKTTLLKLIFRYLGGIGLGMFLNVVGVEILHKNFGFDYLLARFTTAVSVWFIVFLFNKIVVFKAVN